MNRDQMLARMEAILAAAEADSARALTADEQTEFDKLQAQIDELDATASRAADMQARRAAIAAVRARAGVAGPAITPAAAVAAAPARAGVEQPKEFENLGEFMFAALMTPNDPRLASHWREPQDGTRRSAEQRMDTGNLGGFMVPEQFVSAIREVPVQSALIRPRATVIAAGSPPDAKITFPYLDQSADTANVFGGVAVDWVEGEGGTKPGTTGKLGIFSLQPNEWAGVLTVTDKLIRNWAAASQFFTSRIALAASAFEDVNFYRTGTGAGQPLSILNSNAKITVASSGAAGTVSFADIVNMMAVFMMGPNAVWSVSRTLYSQIVTMRNESPGDGSLIFVPGSIVNRIPDTLLGIPIYWNDRAPAASTLGSFALLNLEHYIIKDGSGPFVVSDGGIVNFVNNKTLVKVFGNVDGQPDMKEPFTLEGGLEISPFVILNTAA